MCREQTVRSEVQVGDAGGMDQDRGKGEVQADSGYISKVESAKCGEHSDVGASEKKKLGGLGV